MAELRTRKEAARRLKVTPDQLAKLVHDGELRYVNVGRGKKRPRMRFTDADLDEFIERRTRREVSCPSISPKSRLSTDTISGSEVIGFTARRNARHAERPKK